MQVWPENRWSLWPLISISFRLCGPPWMLQYSHFRRPVASLEVFLFGGLNIENHKCSLVTFQPVPFIRLGVLGRFVIRQSTHEEDPNAKQLSSFASAEQTPRQTFQSKVLRRATSEKRRRERQNRREKILTYDTSSSKLGQPGWQWWREYCLPTPSCSGHLLHRRRWPTLWRVWLQVGISRWLEKVYDLQSPWCALLWSRS